MKVFVAGASGAIGRRLVPQLVAAGHEVTGMTRSPEKVGMLEELGCRPVVADALDAAAVDRAVAEASPEVIVNELTDLPPVYNPRKLKQAYGPNDRVRLGGTRALIDAARAHSVRRLVAQSVAFLYAPGGDGLRAEDAPAFVDAPDPFDASVRALLEMEGQVTGTPGIEGLVLRYGIFYGPGTWYASDGSSAQDARRRRFPIVGQGSGVFSFVHVDDAASATVAALDRGAPGVYNVVDDEPARLADWLPVYARALDAKPPRRVPALLARLFAGSFAVMMATQMSGATNAKAKRELAWEPRYASWRQGFSEALG